MSIKQIRLFILIFATALGFWTLYPTTVLIWAHWIEEFIDGDGELFGFTISTSIVHVCFLLCSLSVVMAWFSSKIGGYLMIISSTLLIILFFMSFEDDFYDWTYFVFIMLGILLVYYSKDRNISNEQNVSDES